MYSIIRNNKRNGSAPINIIVCRVKMKKKDALELARQLATSDANVHNGTANHTLVTPSDVGAWYEKIDGSLVRYWVEPE